VPLPRRRRPAGYDRLVHLPIDDVLPELVSALRRHRAAVLVGPPGSGKTTRVPPGLLYAGFGKVVVLQPRRVAARLAARRIAEERGAGLGGEVGYAVRFDRRTAPDTRIEVVTEGLLTRRLQADPFLEGVGAVVLDEFHERSLHADLALALLREVQGEVRDDLAVVVMSATLDPGPVAAFLGGCPVVEARGRPHPVEVAYVPRPVHPREVDRACAAAVRRALEASEGHVLVFLPGVAEIERTADRLADIEAAVLPLHGRLPLAAQDRALAPSARRKVVLATNIAETSVTLDGVTAVVDCGLARVPRFEPALGLTRLETVPIPRASADQRAGRAGRTGPGVCFRLWTEREHARRPEAAEPDIRRLDLAPALLEVRAWGADPRRFGWFEAPPAGSLAGAEELLERLGAVHGGGLTAVGREIAALPLHPRLARVVVEGRARGCLRAAAGAAALAEEVDPWAGQPGDLLDRIALLDRNDAGADRRALRRVRRVRDQVLRAAGRTDGGDALEEAVVRALLAGFPDRVGQPRGPHDPRVLLASGTGATLDEPTAAALLLAVSLAPGRREPRITLAAPVDEAWLDVREDEVLAFDPDREAVVHRRVRRNGALVLGERPPDTPADPARVAAILAEAARAAPDRALPGDDAGFLARLRFLARAMPALDLPTFEPLEDLLPELCMGRRSFAELRALDLRTELAGRLTWPQREALDRHAPERFEVPSGARVRLDYRPEGPPVLAARIQQLFGLAETPRVAGAPVLLHLLAPNGRPAQVTRDLASFWRTTYTQVRADLRGRYPKHAWPDDPLDARPEDRPRRR